MMRLTEPLKDALIEAITEEGWDADTVQETLNLVYRTPVGTVVELVDGADHMSEFNDMGISDEDDREALEEIDDNILNLVRLIKATQATVLPSGEIITLYSTIDFFGLGRLGGH